jgi:hypothetical protein
VFCVFKETNTEYIYFVKMVVFLGVEVDFVLIKNREATPKEGRRGNRIATLNGGEGVIVWPLLT